MRPRNEIGGGKMGGRRPKPTVLKKLAGNPGKRPLNKNEPQPKSSIPDCPKFLAKEAVLEWKRITVELSVLGVVTQIDRAALAAYCQVWARWAKAEDRLNQEGEFVQTKKGNEIQNPYLAIANKCLKQMREYLVEFGMTPSSRSRISGAPKKRSDERTETLKRLLGPQLIQ